MMGRGMKGQEMDGQNQEILYKRKGSGLIPEPLKNCYLLAMIALIKDTISFALTSSPPIGI